MHFLALKGIMIPFWGTALGSACVFFLKNRITERLDKILTGFAGGVMVAASFFSLIIPAIEGAEHLGRFSFIPAAIGFMGGILFLMLIDTLMPCGNAADFAKTQKLVLAVTIHNLPEGMAVGIAFAGVIYGQSNIAVSSAMALAIGIALQNFPEGAIVSMPLKAAGMSKSKAFIYGTLSGAIEPLGAIATMLTAGFFLPVMPYFLSFAAGAMFYVVIEELLPTNNQKCGTMFFAIGFILMMALDVGLK